MAKTENNATTGPVASFVLSKRFLELLEWSERIRGHARSMRKTKVRIVGDPELAGKVAIIIKEHFELSGSQRFSAMPTRYGTGHSDSPGCSIYLDIKKQKQAEWQKKLEAFYEKLMAFENELIADCGQGRSFEAGIYAGKVANLRKELEKIS